VHKSSKVAQKLTGIKAKLYNKKRYSEKAQMKKT
jgi:ribosome biogenesis protein NSA2